MFQSCEQKIHPLPFRLSNWILDVILSLAWFHVGFTNSSTKICCSIVKINVIEFDSCKQNTSFDFFDEKMLDNSCCQHAFQKTELLIGQTGKFRHE